MKTVRTLSFIAIAAVAAPLFGCQGSVEDGTTLPQDPDTNTTPPPDDGTPTPTPTTSRVTDGLVALYTFDEGTGTTVVDQTGSGYDLTMEDPTAFSWIAGGGLSIDTNSALLNPDPATQIIAPCKASNELTIETWARTNSYLQDGPARVISLSENANNRNFHLAQEYDASIAYADARVRTTDTDDNGTPATMSEDTVWDGQIHHVVYTRSSAAEEGLVFMDGDIAGTLPLPGDFSNWSDDYPLTIGNDPSLNRPWRGQLFLVAIYCKALNATQIAQNMQAGY